MPRLVDIPMLETERLTFRAPEIGDFDALAPFVMSERARYVGGGADKDIGHAWRILATLCGHWHLRGTGVFVAVRKDTGAPIGSMGPWYPDPWPERELSWTIWDSDAEGKGYATEAMIAIRRHVYADLGWDTAVSYVDPKNTRSAALAVCLDCVIDPDAKAPHAEDVVYRHPAPAEVLT
ncbi:GNAT family N-acetyltransferase [Gymnodinialimonas sp. 2305UL16-5]|uniref:GNAT family N-acetyltransferase n=1 Tax=Gymnodinialimonas mytili TaxID=3126503 RepID=UPI00309FAFBB